MKDNHNHLQNSLLQNFDEANDFHFMKENSINTFSLILLKVLYFKPNAFFILGNDFEGILSMFN